MENFAAIDFETANRFRSSVCSVGIVIVRNGEVRQEIYRLIRPEPNYYNPFNTEIHGLTKEDTASSPKFPEIWKEITPLIEGLPLVAHNSPFDESCLKAVFEKYKMEYPCYQFFCTCRASRKRFGNRLPNHKLQTVAEICGFDLRQHHNALADAQACAKIAMTIL